MKNKFCKNHHHSTMHSYSLEPHSEKIEHFQYLCIHLEGFLQVRGIESVQCREEGIYWGCMAISIGSAFNQSWQ